ncbi:MAG: hypothetical protein O7F71_00620, partial [Gammaproteobacteria bacterium]|nr:hypothetical protein [Gammaproteobacteria bacterium]
ARQTVASAEVALDGLVGDKHRGHTRGVWEGDKDPEGTIRRNERQWSGISLEELDGITRELDLAESLTADVVGVNVCVSGIEGFSQLPAGSRLVFPSGAVLAVEEYNPPCLGMSQKISRMFATRSGEPLAKGAFSKASRGRRGIVGVVDVAGQISVGDDIVVEIFAVPNFALPFEAKPDAALNAKT